MEIFKNWIRERDSDKNGYFKNSYGRDFGALSQGISLITHTLTLNKYSQYSNQLFRLTFKKEAGIKLQFRYHYERYLIHIIKGRF